jgi:hypothetical protein
MISLFHDFDIQLLIFVDWDDNLIYIASKKAYIIMQKDNGQVLQSIPHDKLSKLKSLLTFD